MSSSTAVRAARGPGCRPPAARGQRPPGARPPPRGLVPHRRRGRPLRGPHRRSRAARSSVLRRVGRSRHPAPGSGAGAYRRPDLAADRRRCRRVRRPARGRVGVGPGDEPCPCARAARVAHRHRIGPRPRSGRASPSRPRRRGCARSLEPGSGPQRPPRPDVARRPTARRCTWAGSGSPTPSRSPWARRSAPRSSTPARAWLRRSEDLPPGRPRRRSGLGPDRHPARVRRSRRRPLPDAGAAARRPAGGRRPDASAGPRPPCNGSATPTAGSPAPPMTRSWRPAGCWGRSPSIPVKRPPDWAAGHERRPRTRHRAGLGSPGAGGDARPRLVAAGRRRPRSPSGRATALRSSSCPARREASG